LRKAGYKLWIVPHTNIKHFCSKTTNIQKEFDVYKVSENNRLKMITKYRNENVKRDRIAFYRLGGVGDVLMTFPIVKAMKLKYPNSKITYVTSDSCLEVVEGCKYVDKIIVGNEFNKENYDAVYVLRYEDRPKYYMETMAGGVGIYKFDKKMFFDIKEDSLKFSEEKLKDNKNLVAIHCGLTWKTRTWDFEKWKKVIEWLHKKGFNIVEIGRSDTPLLNSGIDLRGRTTVNQLAGVLSKCRLFVGLDSFPLHLAKAVGIPVIGLYGSTLPEYVESYDMTNSYPVVTDCTCKGCRNVTVGNFVNCAKKKVECMEGISVESVQERIQEALQV